MDHTVNSQLLFSGSRRGHWLWVIANDQLSAVRGQKRLKFCRSFFWTMFVVISICFFVVVCFLNRVTVVISQHEYATDVKTFLRFLLLSHFYVF